MFPFNNNQKKKKKKMQEFAFKYLGIQVLVLHIVKLHNSH
jgi:hypothetical protein